METRIRNNFRVLGIETSCDETAAAVVECERPSPKSRSRTSSVGKFDFPKLRVLSNVVSSQIDVHRKTGGVVPEVAAREHVKTIVPTIRAALQNAARKLPITNYQLLRPDVIAVTNGPGLITSLMVGVETARTLAAAWNVPLIGVNHLEGHILAAFLPHKNYQLSRHSGTPPWRWPVTSYQFPMLALLVSGGHTELVLMRRWLHYDVMGETLDDAAGEAFDKVAKILGLGYPGGPAIEHAAKRGDAREEPFTPPMLDSDDFNFSFSGIKTAVLYRLRDSGSLTSRIGKLNFTNFRCDVAAGFQKAVVDVLVAKTLRAAQKYKAKTIILCGGVAANARLRSELASTLKNQLPNSRFQVPDSKFCTDNAAMIAAAGALSALHQKFTPWKNVTTNPTLGLTSRLSKS